MKKTLKAVIVVACLMVVSLSIFTLPRIQIAESVKIQNEKNATDTHDQSTDSVPMSDVNERSDEIDDSYEIQDEQVLDQNDFTVWNTETGQNQISGLPLPIPDGRVFLRANADAEDPIPYIPTQDPKTAGGIPTVPPELEI